jgi:hypothetical protein
VEIKSPHRCPINWLDIDESEGRYLLTAASDGSIALFDLDGNGDGKYANASLLHCSATALIHIIAWHISSKAVCLSLLELSDCADVCLPAHMTGAMQVEMLVAVGEESCNGCALHRECLHQHIKQQQQQCKAIAIVLVQFR